MDQETKQIEQPNPKQNKTIKTLATVGALVLAVNLALTAWLITKVPSTDHGKAEEAAASQTEAYPEPAVLKDVKKPASVEEAVAAKLNEKLAADPKTKAYANVKADDLKAAPVKPDAIEGKNEDKLSKRLEEAIMSVGKIDRVVKLDFDDAHAVHSDNGQILFMSGNGRFVLVGDLIDVWQKKELKTIEEIADATSRIPVEDLGLTPEGMNTLTLGTGPKVVSAFVDPHCGWCHRLITEVKDDAQLLKDFTVNFYVVPALGAASNEVAKHLYCAKADGKQKLEAFIGGPDKIKALPRDEACNTQGYDQTLMTAQLLGVKGVPFVIAPDGRSVEGKPRSLRNFLEPQTDAKAPAKP